MGREKDICQLLPDVLEVEVNKTNIRKGVKGEAETCAVSKAIQRAISAKRRGLTVVVSGGTDISVKEDGFYGDTVNYKVNTCKGQDRLDNYINRFDNQPKRKTKPTKFVLVKCDKYGY